MKYTVGTKLYDRNSEDPREFIVTQISGQRLFLHCVTTDQPVGGPIYLSSMDYIFITKKEVDGAIFDNQLEDILK